MGFVIKSDTQVRVLDDSGVSVISGPGGCPWIMDPARPHLGGNFDGGDLGTWYKEDLWPWLIDEFKVKIVADIGCGTGETLKWFLDHHCDGFGVEGLPWNVDRARERGLPDVRQHDFTVDGPCVFDNVDLVWCSDVAEHVAEEHVGSFLTTVRQCRVLAMCQGTEANANDGWGHVNNKPEQYWIDKLAAVGMVEDPALTAKSREIGNHGWWAATGHIYVRGAE